MITKPYFPDQNNPQPSLPGSKPKESPLIPQTTRQSSTTNASSNALKKKVRTSDQTKAIAALNKKKQAEALDPRAATIKAMMQQAQRQAQQTQIQIQQQLHSGSHLSSSNSPTIHPVNQDGTNATSPKDPNNDSSQMINETSPTIPIVTNKPPAQPRRVIQQQQQLQQQPFRMQPPMPHQMPMNQNGTMPLTPQQLQQMYFNAAQQQQLMMANQQAQQVRARMGMGPVPMGPGMMGRPNMMNMQPYMPPLHDPPTPPVKKP